MINEVFHFLLYIYQHLLDESQRLTLIDQYMILLFTVIQNKNLPPQLRNGLVELVFKLFQIDAQAFKNFVQTQATVPEKALTEKILKELTQRMANMKQTTATANQSSPNTTNKANTIATAQSDTGPQRQGKIQLTMNFKKK